jgi:hypothetical protein
LLSCLGWRRRACGWICRNWLFFSRFCCSHYCEQFLITASTAWAVRTCICSDILLPTIILHSFAFTKPLSRLPCLSTHGQRVSTAHHFSLFTYTEQLVFQR